MYVDRSRFFTRLLMVLCFFIWSIVAFQVSAFALTVPSIYTGPPNFPSVNQIYKHYNGWYLKTTGVYIDSTYTNSVIPASYEISVDSYPSLILVVKIRLSPTQVRMVALYCVQVSAGDYETSEAYYSDPDGDGLIGAIDPCPEVSDKNMKIYRTKNKCTGSYYFFQITGECGQTKTMYNPQYATLNDALNAAKTADPECFDAVTDSDRVPMTADQLANWWNSHSENVGTDGGDINFDASSPDPTGGNSTSNIPPKPADASDPDTQKVIDQIERMKKAVEVAVEASGRRVADQIDMTGKDIVGGLKNVEGAVDGISFAGVANAVGNAAGTAHSDAAALLAAVNAMSAKVGEGNSTVSLVALTKDELEEENNRLYATNDGVGFETSAVSFSGSLLSHIQTWTNTLKNHVLGILPVSTVSTVNPTPCMSYNGNIVDAKGNTYVLTDYCFDDWGPSLSMIGNMLFAVFSIVCLFSVFKMA